jgi:hypothetical protein
MIQIFLNLTTKRKCRGDPDKIGIFNRLGRPHIKKILTAAQRRKGNYEKRQMKNEKILNNFVDKKERLTTKTTRKIKKKEYTQKIILIVASWRRCDSAEVLWSDLCAPGMGVI